MSIPVQFSNLRRPSIIKGGYSHYKSIKKRINDTKDENLIQVPHWYFPHAGHTGSIWIELQPLELKSINSAGRGGNYDVSKFGPLYKFLAPDDGILEASNHEWNTYETIFSKLLAMEAKLGTAWTQGQQIAGSLWGSVVRAFEAGDFPSGEQMLAALHAAVAVDIPKKKVDAPLSYTNSPRRQFMFTFQLLSEGLKTDLVEIVKNISAYSAPSSVGNIHIKWPHLWSIQTDPKGVLDVDLAACTSVQSTWKHPYKNGIPQRCELTLNFTDISPLFADTIRVGSLVRIAKNLDRKSFAEDVKDRTTFSATKEINKVKDRAKWVAGKLGYPS